MVVIILNKIFLFVCLFCLEYRFCYIYNMAVDVMFGLVGVAASGPCLFACLLLNFFIIRSILTLYAG